LSSGQTAPHPAAAGSTPRVGCAVLGAGPAGLSAAYVLARHGREAEVFEADGIVGGLSKTVEFNGYRFDLGGHRFYTKLKPLERLWQQMLGDELLRRPRLSRIYYGGRFFQYPLEARNVLRGLGMRESARCGLSYARSRIAPRRQDVTFEDWVTARFGRRLYHRFFRSYTEKVWGIPASEIQAEWAAQRIKNFSFAHAVGAMIGVSKPHMTTLIEEFNYPRLGPGQMWEAFADYVRGAGVPVRLNQRCVSVRHLDRHVESLVFGTNGGQTEIAVDSVLSSIPLRELVLSLDPAPPDEVAAAAERLRYRDLCLVALIIDEPTPFPDNWIYLHDPGTRAARVQNFGAWSESMVVPNTTCLGVEYFCFAGEEIWELPDDTAVALATDELARIGLIDAKKVVDGVKVRVPKAYPMYDADYREAVAVIRAYLDGFDNLQTFGRNGLHRYNNQDHSMWTAILAALNLVNGTDFDVWSVNTEQEYLEEGAVVERVLESELVL